MPLQRGSKLTWRNFNFGLSYRLNETETRFRDVNNTFSNQGRLETRHGTSRLNSSSLGGSVLSLSYFEETDNTRHILAKVGTALYDVTTAGSSSSIKTGLTAAHKHRSITLNNRSIIAIEDDGLFQYDGTTFTQLGQDPPTAPSVASSGSGNNLTASDYQVALTFYSTTTGFETNQGVASSTVTVGSGEQIDVTSIPTTAANGTIDKVRVYLKDVTAGGSFLFWEEINLGTATNTIDDDPTSTQTPPSRNASPSSGGGKFLTEFNERLVYAGSQTFPNDVFFSEPNLPDAFNDDGTTNKTLVITGDGNVTGIATGLYNQDTLNPYLVIFKKTATWVYSEIDDFGRLVKLNDEIGCVSHDTIQVRNGDIYFLSQKGWRVISNGDLVQNKGEPITLGDGDIDDIFKQSGFSFEVNRAQFRNFFSVYYETLDQYLTWVAEGSSTDFNICYPFQFEVPGFTKYTFPQFLSAATTGEDADGDEVIYMGDTSGYIYTHSIEESRTDKDSSDSSVKIPANATVYWIQGDDFDASYNFREFIVRAVNSSNDITVQAWINFDLGDLNTYDYSFPATSSGFILDVSKLDEGIFGDERQIITARSDINRVGENIAIGFFQEVEDGNLNLVSAQLHFSKNGNRN